MTRVHVVIHHVNAELTLEEAEQAIALGADGVFLISHEGEDGALPALASALASRWRGAKTRRLERPLVGMSLLQTPAVQALASAGDAGANALWVSMPGVTSEGVTEEGRRLCKAMGRHPAVRVFGCVAFKYQPDEPDPPAAAVAAMEVGMLPTTSGAGTAQAPDVGKIEAMSRSVGGLLAIASGMTPENVGAYAPLVSDILVSTGVSRDAHHVDPERLQAFLAEVTRARCAPDGAGRKS